ncbi:MAG: alpha-2-macroglobulin family protein, partial [Flavisolibacter sp.]
DVTDMNGETRSQQNHITAGYVSIVLKTDIPERIPVDSLKNISIRTENMNGQFHPSVVNIVVYQLLPEQRLVRNRLWPKPDRYIMSKEEFIKFFPHDEYGTEKDFKTWERGDVVYRKSDSSKVNSEWPLSVALKTGYYAIEVTTKDDDGNEVKDIKYMELFDLHSNELKHPEYMWTYKPEKNYEPGETATVQLGSSENVFLIQKRNDFGNEEPSSRYLFQNLNKEKQTFSFPIREENRGNFEVDFFFVKNNRFYQSGNMINVPWSNKDLAIEFATFRDKTLPGSEEKWKVKIRGSKNEKVAAEMLAGMYDASLDQFIQHNWQKPTLWVEHNNPVSWSGYENFMSINSFNKLIPNYFQGKVIEQTYDQLLTILWQNLRSYREGATGNYRMLSRAAPPKLEGRSQSAPMNAQIAPVRGNKYEDVVAADSVYIGYGDLDNNIENKQVPPIQPRKNFNETAFFFPDLRTDSSGAVEFSFTVPEALTRWKIQTLAHTKDLAFGLSQKEMVTQKELMIQPNMPRFLRQGDRIELVTKIVNQSDSEMTGQVQLQLFDAATNQSVDGWFVNSFPNQYFTIAAKQSTVVRFPVQVPFQFNSALTWRFTASTASPSSKAIIYSDGEEDHLPVLSNRVLITETIPLPMKGSGTKNFVFTKLLQSANSESLQHHSLTVEYTANPAWYAVQALRYLMEYPYECAEQTWNRYYANALASGIVNKAPKIRQMFNEWKTLDTSALLSNLEKNQELKSALLEETPWVLDAKNESQQKKNIALLFDLVRMQSELNSNLARLRAMLKDEGSFPWFQGGPSDRYITQYIATGIGHLIKLKSIPSDQVNDVMVVIRTIVPYLDRKFNEDYQKLLKSKADLSRQHINPILVHYLYMRSFFKDPSVAANIQKALAFYQGQAKKYWTKLPVYEQGMIALTLYRNGDTKTAGDILRSLKETSIVNDELGRYWKYNAYGRSWFWYTAPIETQSLMVEVFTEIGKDLATADELRTWLIRNKQTNNWNTTKATADACYAMLLRGTDWLASTPSVSIQLGNTIIQTDKTEAGTGYFKQNIDADSITPAMGNISVTVSSSPNSNQQPVSSWGSVYWQYFEDMDKVTPASTPLQLNKKLFIERNTDKGPVLTPIEEGTTLHVGDKIKVRIELRTDRDMEYVHMKDLRASALEPINVLSGYKWQGGLGYYESTKDASTNFFFDVLRKGTYVFEYPLFVTHNGSFSNGITSIQCMYAPEFSAHSEGVSFRVEE